MISALKALKTVVLLILILGTPVLVDLWLDRDYARLAGFDKFGFSTIVPSFAVWLTVAIYYSRYMYVYPEREPRLYKDWRFWVTLLGVFAPIVFNQTSIWVAGLGYDTLAQYLFAVRYMAAGAVWSIVVGSVVAAQCFGSKL